jgi:hypothetical protein
MDLKEIGYDGVDWIELDQDDSTAGLGELGNEPSGYIKDEKSFDKPNYYHLLKNGSATWIRPTGGKLGEHLVHLFNDINRKEAD